VAICSARSLYSGPGAELLLDKRTRGGGVFCHAAPGAPVIVGLEVQLHNVTFTMRCCRVGLYYTSS